MTVKTLIEYLMTCMDDEEIEIEIRETSSGKYIDTTADITIVEDTCAPTLRIDVEAEKFKS